jgi:drug/metabolite transporter (DMT)-like permease
VNRSILLGTMFAAAAAVAFGVTTPFIQRFGAGAGPFTTAALLYLGAVLGSLSIPRRTESRRESAFRSAHLPRLLAVAFFGAVLAPSLLAWGLQRVPATFGSLLLCSEAVFTLVLAAALCHEHVGGRVALAAALMSVGGAATVVGASTAAPVGLLGALAICAAALSWALDNVLTRPLAELDPAAVVRAKAACGAVLAGTLGLLLREPRPAWAGAIGLAACGATGYGLSLRLYLRAQRRIGAGRTGSVFALAPFVGASTAVILGEQHVNGTTLVAGALLLAGVVLHASERHEHLHRHEELEHDHAHSHDDGHHQHRHQGAPGDVHAHPHRHDGQAHAHAHGPDVHHDHGHSGTR